MTSASERGTDVESYIEAAAAIVDAALVDGSTLSHWVVVNSTTSFPSDCGQPVHPPLLSPLRH